MNALKMTLAAALALALAPAARAEARDGNLDRELKKHAPEIIKYLRDKDYQNVGVLKFLAQRGKDGPPRDNLGPINLGLANRLEVALVLANPDDKLGVIERASAAVVKAQNKRANHRTKEGRLALFDVAYTLAWGDKPVKADAFLTGLVEFSPDLKTVNVTVLAFDRRGEEPEKVCAFSAATDARTLAEAGESFLLKGARGAFDNGELLVQATQSAVQTSEQKATYPLEESPVELKVLYDGREVPVAKNGTVPEPREGQKVTFALKNRGRERYGVVLLVNGENTIFRERLDPALCYKWLLDPGEALKVGGFQLNLDKRADFEVLSPEASEKDEVRYNEHAGTFSLVVFRQLPEESKNALALAKTEEAQDVAAIGRGLLRVEDKPKPASLKALQAALKKREGSSPDPNQRGYVTAGPEGDNKIRKEPFRTDPIPVVTATVRYYQPRR